MNQDHDGYDGVDIGDVEQTEYTFDSLFNEAEVTLVEEDCLEEEEEWLALLGNQPAATTTTNAEEYMEEIFRRRETVRKNSRASYVRQMESNKQFWAGCRDELLDW